MTVYPPQPTLPAEGQFTDPELNFIDESPRGFFPDNQDSNWGYKRKIYSDQIKALFDQLAFVYSEMFPTTSQELLDEWEKTVGLPQNPSSKTLAQRRTMVLNRLRGGPFTRKQRREIVESYISATFGDPLLLLPPGIPMIVAGHQLFNEPGDPVTLYMIVETVDQFKYEVRIQSGLAIDQVGLERDLHHFTPAGINILFDYAWTFKSGSDSGTAVDNVNAATGSGFIITVSEFGVGRESIGIKGTDTGTGADASAVGLTSTQTGIATEVASFTIAIPDTDGGVGIESLNRKIAVSETGSGSEASSTQGGPVITGFSPTSGPIFTLVTIDGSGFTGATAVSFGGNSIYPFTVVNDGRITAQAPASGVVRVQTPFGLATSAGSFTVV